MRLLHPAVFVLFGLCLVLTIPDLLLGDMPKSDSVERLVLIDGKTVNGWEAIESALSPAVLEGASALLFSVPVDWSTGEPSYPIGWPRIQMSVPGEMSDWRGWDRMRMRVYALTSRDPLPYRPLGVTVSSGDRNVSWERDAEGLRAGEWREFTFDLRDIPQRDRVRSIGVFISEDAYPDGEKLSFYISDLELLRYARPTLVDFDLLASVAFVDAKGVPLAVHVLGLAEGAAEPVALRLTMGENVLSRTEARVPEGVTQISLPIPAGLSPGQYSVFVSAAGHELSRTVRLISSPWQEIAR